MQLKYDKAKLIESAEPLENPYRGFYSLLCFPLTDDRSDAEFSWWLSYYIAGNAHDLLLLEFGLQNYSARPVSRRALDEIDRILDAASAHKKKVILRFVYDWDGRPEETEPRDPDLVRQHIRQIAKVVNRHTDTVFLLQGCFTGAYGEMHSGSYANLPPITGFVRLLQDTIDPSVFLAVRTPALQRGITGSTLSVTAGNAFDGTLPSRLGLFNDGIFGSGTDLGTYAHPSWPGLRPEEKWLRDRELAFQEELCRYVPNGGEAVGERGDETPDKDLEHTDSGNGGAAVNGNGVSDFAVLIRDLSRMHVSYLNDEYDPKTIERWKNTRDGSVSLFDYVGAHLGYRYVCRNFAAALVRSGETGETMKNVETAETGETVEDRKTAGDKETGRSIRLQIVLQNTGFAPAYRRFDFTLTLVNRDTGKTLSLPLPFDNRFLAGNGAKADLTADLPAERLEGGSYTVYLSASDPAGAVPVRFANRIPSALPGQASLPLGTLYCF